MNPNAILHEVQQLYSISDRLDILAEKHPLLSEALLGISGSVRNTATLLEVLVATKLPATEGQIQRMPNLSDRRSWLWDKPSHEELC